MTELDQVWSQMLSDAAAQAGTLGRHEVAEYLRLKATNDAIRATGVAWLIDTFVEAGSEAMAAAPHLTIDREEPHAFAHGGSTMVGTLLTLRLGVRSMTVEAGWARHPSHGVMRGGALAFAHIEHFGLPKAGAQLRLVFADDLPAWLIGETGRRFDADTRTEHVAIVLK